LPPALEHLPAIEDAALLAVRSGREEPRLAGWVQASDRMIFRFLERVLGRPVGADEAQAMLTAAALELDREFPGIKPRTLNNLIWRQERER